MSDASMKSSLERWYRDHPARGARAAATETAADTFVVSNYRFDTDGRATQVDTCRIVVGQSVMWKWVAGFHTTTSGTPEDPTPGLFWDQPLDAANPSFTFMFDEQGEYPFFCVLHGALLNMKGVVIVSANGLDVPPSPGEAGRAGFLASPWPNPTRAGASFRFGVERGGEVRLAVFDLAGREVALIADGPLPAGVHVRHWNGRLRDGTAAAPGTYFARLVAPGHQSSARVVVAR
jgi:plastocyanin